MKWPLDVEHHAFVWVQVLNKQHAPKQCQIDVSCLDLKQAWCLNQHPMPRQPQQAGEFQNWVRCEQSATVVEVGTPFSSRVIS